MAEMPGRPEPGGGGVARALKNLMRCAALVVLTVAASLAMSGPFTSAA